jgi:hypothetical protein
MTQLFLNCPSASLDGECRPLDPDEHADMPTLRSSDRQDVTSNSCSR